MRQMQGFIAKPVGSVKRGGSCQVWHGVLVATCDPFTDHDVMVVRKAVGIALPHAHGRVIEPTTCGAFA